MKKIAMLLIALMLISVGVLTGCTSQYTSTNDEDEQEENLVDDETREELEKALEFVEM